MRLQTLTALALCATLPACAPFWAKPDLTVADLKCPSEATAAVPEAPRVPDDAGFPSPVTPVEKLSVGKYMEFISAYGDDNQEKTRRLIKIKRWCDSR